MKTTNSFILFLIIIIFYLIPACSKKKNSIHNDSYIIAILDQKENKRVFAEDSLNLIAKINISNKIYIPMFCEFDENGNIYILDRSTCYIHKFLPIKNAYNYSHIYFGKGKGQGPGELSDPRDFEIYKNKLYIVDPSNGCIEVYSTEGENLKRIKLSNHLTPGKIIILNNKLLVEPYIYTGKELFYFYDDSGNLISSFGSYIDNSNIFNGVYHDNDILKLSENCFSYIPKYLGFIGIYQDDSLKFAKATIDGLKKPVAINNKEIMEGVFVSKIKKTFYTAATAACNSKYLILQAIDIQKKIEWYDLYYLDGFHYLKSIKNLPSLIYFDINDTLFVGVNDTCLYVWNLKSIML